jgi:hypothetical protein
MRAVRAPSIMAVLELCAGRLTCTVLRGPDPKNGVWLLGATKESRWGKNHPPRIVKPEMQRFDFPRVVIIKPQQFAVL